jgi:4-amino-4-deoxy-L-arabinose transferase-like glycosyltransferase
MPTRIRTALGGEAALLLAAVVAFIAVSVWWLTQDSRVQDWDNGLHTLIAFGIHDQIASGHLGGWFTEFNTYPPLAHLVGAGAVAVAGKSPMAVILASNIVFLPILAFATYGAGRLAYGPRAGLLAGLFALGTPILVSQMHVFMIDPPEAAMVAASVWAILASRRFERIGTSALAGALVGLAMMTKETSIVFVAGLVAVVLARGGWARWRGLLLFVVIAAAISLPWYVDHLQQLNGLVEGQGGTGAAPTLEAAPALLSRASLAWYLWAALNIELLLPLSLFLLAGVAWTVISCVRDRRPDNLGPELLGGAFVSWLGITLVRHKDPRFILPALVYVAVLSTGWIAVARPRLRLAASAALVAIVAVNFLAVSVGIGHTVRVALPGAPAVSGVHARRLTLYSPDGYIRGGPERDGDVLALMRALKREGVHSVTFDAGSTDVSDFTVYGLQVRAIQAGLPTPGAYDPAALGPRDAFMLRHVPTPGDAPPCQRLQDGSGVYVELGNPVKPFETYTFTCPTRGPAVYHRTAPLSLETELQLHPEITGPPRAMLLAVLGALHRQGVQAIQFDRASAGALFFQPGGLERLAALVQLPVPAGLSPAQLGPTDAYLLRRSLTPGAAPPAGAVPAAAVPAGVAPCGRFPDGTGLFVVRGNPTVAHPRYACPLAPARAGTRPR